MAVRSVESNKAPSAGLETLDASSWVANDLGHGDFRGAAEFGAVSCEIMHFDPDLNRLIDAWDTLPHTVKKVVLGHIDGYLGLETEPRHDG